MKRLCVYCGSSRGALDSYQTSAIALGKILLKNKVELVYGGASVGIMGVVADTVLEGGGSVTGIIPQSLVDKEVAHPSLSNLIVVNSMHERKAQMAELADGFIALPGGFGTLEELFEVLTWAQLGFHQKPCGILNVSGYFDGLVQFLDHSVNQGFVKGFHRDMLMVSERPEDLIEKLHSYKPVNTEKWIDREQL